MGLEEQLLVPESDIDIKDPMESEVCSLLWVITLTSASEDPVKVETCKA